MINALGSDWKSHLSDGSVPTDRIYSDFRLLEYPDLETGSAVYSLAREDNLIDRPGCESTTAPMIFGETVPLLSNATFARSADFSHTGDYSYKHTKIIAAGTAGIVRLIDALSTTNMHGLVAGSTYNLTTWVYIPTASGILGTEVTFQLDDHNGVGWSSNAVVAANTYDAWQQITLPVTLRDGALGTHLSILAASAAADTEYFYVDDIRLTTHNIPGSHYLSSGYTEHLLEMPDTFTLQIKFKPNFAHDTGSHQGVFEWYVSATQYFRFFYHFGADQFFASWQDGGNSRSLGSVQYDDGSSHRNINQYITMTVAIDLTTGDITGSALWMNKTQDDTAWNAAIDTKTTEFNSVMFRRNTSLSTTGDYDIAYVRFFSGLVATDAQVQNDFKDVKNEEIFFSLDGHGTGRSRCNITRFVGSLTTTKQVQNLSSGSQCANRCGVLLFNRDNDGQGYFSDDQYAAYDPTADQFNGTVNQKYLQRRSNVTIENWYDGDFDTAFFGKVNSSLYTRSTQDQTYGTVGISCDDYIGLIARTSVEKGRYYEDYDLCDTASESTSLLHVITRLATKRPVYNYLSNSSFENANIGNSWLVTAGGAFTKDATHVLFGGNAGMLIPGAANEQGYQTVVFTSEDSLNVGETYNFSIWLYSVGAATSGANYILINENDSVGVNDYTATVYQLSGGEGYSKVEVSHTITDSDSDRIVVQISADAGDIIWTEGASLIRGDRALNYFVLNNNDGVAGVSNADDADSDSYDIMGFDVESIAITHPWRRIDENMSMWGYLKGIDDATAGSYIGLNSAGTFKHRSRLATDYEDPIPYGTLTMTRGLGTSIDLNSKNNIVVHGVNIVKDNLIQIVWEAGASHAFPLTDNGTINEAVAANGIWPDPDTYGDSFVARYGNNDRDNEGVPPLDVPVDDVPSEPGISEVSFWDEYIKNTKDAWRSVFSPGLG